MARIFAVYYAMLYPQNDGRIVTRYGNSHATWDHSVTCHPAEVTLPPVVSLHPMYVCVYTYCACITSERFVL